ncbi:MAG: hypothetical protein ABL967_00685 [Bryobacteraceae bacterium]
MVPTAVAFRSDLFPPYPGEEEEVNPGLWGKRLAEFLAEKLRTRGFASDEPFAEDWGWTVPIVNAEFPLWIGCGHQDGDADQFLCFIEPHTPTVCKFLKTIRTEDRVAALQAALDEVLRAETGVKEMEWQIADEKQNAS